MMVDDLPVAWDEAHATFTALDKCVYETKGLGLSREQDDMMVCDCVYDKRESHQPCIPLGYSVVAGGQDQETEELDAGILSARKGKEIAIGKKRRPNRIAGIIPILGVMLTQPGNPGETQCGPQSDCVNRAIFIECLSAECRAKDQCRNQRYVPPPAD